MSKSERELIVELEAVLIGRRYKPGSDQKLLQLRPRVYGLSNTTRNSGR